MYSKVRNTLVSLAVATFMVGVSYSVGHPPVRSQPRADFASPAIDAQLNEVQLVQKRNRGMRSQLSMPFFSFAPLLPRRES
jgi:hypothetical protein